MKSDQTGYVNKDRLPDETCSCDVFDLDSHGLSEEKQKEICRVLNGFDETKAQTTRDARQNKLDYMRSLGGKDTSEGQYALHWIRYQ